jgi:hypothetical protein
MTKRLRFMTALNCNGGASGQLTWEEDASAIPAHVPVNYEVVSITGQFAPNGPGKAICLGCTASSWGELLAPSGLDDTWTQNR